MASANFLEEALSTDVDESAVSAIVGSLENQLVTSTPAASSQTGSTVVINQNHVNSAIPNGGTVPSQKHGAIANGDSVNVVTTADASKLVTNSLPGTIITAAATAGTVVQGAPATNFTDPASKPAEQTVKIVGGQAMTSTGAIISNRVSFPAQSLPNGTIGLAPITPQTNTANVQTIQAKQPTLVIKTSAAPGSGAPGLVTVPMNVTASVPQVNNVGSPTTQTTPNILSNLQVVNVRPGVPAQGQKGQPARVVLSAPQLVGARPGAPVS